MSEENAPAVETQAPPANTPDPGQQQPAENSSWKEFLPEDLRGEKAFTVYKDDPKEGIAALAKSHLSLQKTLGDSFRRPADDAPEEEWNAFYGKLGRPETPEAYKYEKPQDLPEVAGWDEKALGEFKQAAHAKGFTADQFNFVMEQFGGVVKRSWIEAENMKEKAATEGKATLRKEWGPDFEKNMTTAQRAFKQFATAEELELVSNDIVANNPDVTRIFARVGQFLSEHKDLGGASDDWLDPESAAIEINRIRKDKGHPLHEAYHNDKHPDHKKASSRMEQLYSVKTAKREE